MRYFLKRMMENIPLLPDSLRQEIGNPTQTGRLPDASAVELEFPVATGTLDENKAEARKALGKALFLALVLSAVQFFDYWQFSSIVLNLIAALGFFFFLRGYFEARPSGWSWFWYLLVLPHVGFTLVALRHPSVALLLTACCALIAADLFAAHFYHLQTTAPMERSRALRLRALWKKRFRLSHAAKGMELYALTLIAIPFVAVALILWSRLNPLVLTWQNLPRLAAAFAVLIFWPYLVELFAAFLYPRRALRLSGMLRHFWLALVQWLTYNRRRIQAPGAYQTPAGSFTARRRISRGLILMLGAFMIPQLNVRSDVERTFELAQLEAMQVRDSDPEPTPAAPRYGDQMPLDRIPLENGPPPGGWVYIPDQLPDDQIPPRERSRQPATPTPTPEPALQLEPYQERMLERMPEAERERYLTRLRSEQSTQPAPVPAQPGFLSEEGRPALLLNWLTGFYSVLYRLSYPVVSSALIIALLLAFAYSTTGRIAAIFGPNSDLDPSELFSSQHWDALVARVRSSQDQTERHSLLLGVNADDNSPVLVPRSVFAEHAHLLGDSGSGKTSIGIASILSQIARFGDCSIIVLDLKGDDMALFEGARREAAQANLPFRWFTNQLERSTYVFNPLEQEYLRKLSVYQKTDMLTAAMGLQYGRDYGRAYFADTNARLLQLAFEAQNDVNSFRKLKQLLDSPSRIGASPQLRKDAAHVATIVSRLADSTQLNVTRDDDRYAPETAEHAIQFADVFRKPQVVYFHLTSTLGTSSAAEIARIALYSLLASANNQPATKRVQTFVFIDEFQRIVSGNLELVLQLARSLNIGVILANQTLMDLKTGGVDLIPSISANTRFKQVFAASNLDEQQDLSLGSGEAVVHRQSWHEYLGVTHVIDGRNIAEHITPRLRPNDILLATDHPLQSIVHIRRGAGYAQYGGLPFIMRSSHHISLQEYDERKDAPWPEPTEETIVASLNEGNGHVDPPKKPQQTARSPFLDETKPPPQGEPRQQDPLFEMFQEQQARRELQITGPDPEDQSSEDEA